MNKKVIPITFIVLLIMSCFVEPKENDTKIIDIQISEKDTLIEEVVQKEDFIDEEPSINYDLNIINDNIEFSNLPNINNNEKYAVVASNKSIFYAYTELNNNDDLDKLSEGESIPIGTIITIEEVIDIKDSIHENYFSYQGDKNYFYKTTINNNIGLIWGADLLLNLQTVDEVKRTSYNYTKNVKNSEFLPFNGKYNLSTKNLSEISESRISIDSIIDKEDMIKLYQNDASVRDNSIFITTDVFTSVLNVFYKNIKRSTEVNYLHGELSYLVDLVLKDIDEYEKEDNKKNKKYTQTLTTVKNYFLMSKVLINYTDDGEKINEILTHMPQVVIDEFSLITTETGTSLSPILESDQDYSSFTPPKSYLDNDILKSYFMTLNWFSEMNLNARTVLVIGNIFKEDLDLKSKLNNISKILIYFSGKSTYLSLNDIITSLDKMDIYNLSYWMEDDDNVVQSIRSSDKFKLFSQSSQIKILLKNFGWDSSLEFVASLGSLTAESILKQSGEYGENEYNKLELEDGTYIKDFISLLSSIATFEQNRNFYFMEKGKWNQKILNETHASWLEYESDLDFIINKDYPIVLEESDNLITFRTLEYSEPIHYIEPNKKYFEQFGDILLELQTVTNLKDYDTELNDKLDKLLEIVKETQNIVDLEQNKDSISVEQNNFIRSLPTNLKTIIGDLGSYIPVSNIINRNIDKNTVLEAGVGFPYRIFIALDDDNGGKRIATGYSYSYYEFENESENISSDISWIKKDNVPFWSQESLK